MRCYHNEYGRLRMDGAAVTTSEWLELKERVSGRRSIYGGCLDFYVGLWAWVQHALMDTWFRFICGETLRIYGPVRRDGSFRPKYSFDYIHTYGVPSSAKKGIYTLFSSSWWVGAEPTDRNSK
jgi:hypothetical protein